MNKGWIGVDLDGTLALYEKWISPAYIGDPIPNMVNRVKQWLKEDKEVKIFTARVSHDGTVERKRDAILARTAIEKWCEEYLGVRLEITCCKDYNMIELWDDRAVQVEHNTGNPVGHSTRGST